jgi:hypothetical protein
MWVAGSGGSAGEGVEVTVGGAMLACEVGRDASVFFIALIRLEGIAETLTPRFAFSAVDTGRGPSFTFGLNSSSYLLKSYGSSSME